MHTYTNSFPLIKIIYLISNKTLVCIDHCYNYLPNEIQFVFELLVLILIMDCHMKHDFTNNLILMCAVDIMTSVVLLVDF